MKIKINIDYRGSSKILKRLCQVVNYLSEHGSGDMEKEVYDKNDNGIVDNAEKVNDHSVYADVPADAKFTDTIYDDTLISGRVKANQNNIDMLISALFHSEERYLIDSEGYILTDSHGFPLYSAKYISMLAELQAAVSELTARRFVYSDGSYDDPNT